MSTTVKTGWLKDNNGDKFAPKTLTSQVQTSDGVLLEDKIQADLDTMKAEIQADIENIDLSAYETTEDAQSKLDEAKTYADTAVSGKANTSHSHIISDVTNLQSTLDGKVPTSRTVNGKSLTANISLSASDVGAASSTHTHDDRYYTETEIDTKISTINTSINNITNGDTTVAKAEEATHATSADSATTATTATKLGSSTVGSSTQPIYLNSGTATKVSYVGTAYGGTGATTVAGARTNLEVYSKSEVDSALSGKASTSHNHDSAYDTKGAAADVQENLDTVSDELDSHTSNTDVHVTTSNKSNWNTAYTHSQAAHARTDATKVADSTTNGNILINGTETNVYSHPNSGVTAGTYKSVTVNAQGHITSGSNPTTLSGYGITDAETKGAASSALASAKEYTDTKTTGLASTSSVNVNISSHNTSTSAHNDIRELIDDLTTKLNNFLDVDDTTTDQLSEVITLINNNKGTLESLTTSKINVSDIVNNLTTNSTSKVLSAAQGVAIKSLIDALQAELDGIVEITSTEIRNLFSV